MILARTVAIAVCALFLVPIPSAHAQVVDVTVFAGRAFPTYDERLSISPSSPFPGVELTVEGAPLIRADGGPVFGAAVGFEFRRLGIEARLDATDVGLEFSGARFNLRGTGFFQGVTATITAAPGRFDAQRIPLLSLNARYTRPGRVAFVGSGGLSFLPDFEVTGAIPLTVDAPAFLALPETSAALTLRAAPDEATHRFGVNAGGGVRVGDRIAFTADVRAFYFREFTLGFARANGPELLDELLLGATPVHFTPVFLNAQVGVSFRF